MFKILRSIYAFNILIFSCKFQKIPDIASVLDIGDVKLITIETSSSEGLCGVSYLDVGDSYELTGFLIKNFLYLRIFQLSVEIFVYNFTIHWLHGKMLTWKLWSCLLRRF